jgi:murein DD-endopeptidase MepM/ murein hydrolase activator NlpD
MRWPWISLVGAAVAIVRCAPLGGAGPDGPPTPAAACSGFDFPVGPPDAHGYYDAQPFGTNDHLGNDWNGNGGGDSDLGDPVHAIAAGVVSAAGDLGGGWGNVVRVVHVCREVPGQEQEIESLYAHLDTIEVHAGQRVGRGQQLGTIGTAGGQYRAHLHLELRARPGMPLGGGYSKDTTGYLDPSAFIRRHR